MRAKEHMGADWVERNTGQKLSPLGRDVAELLGAAYAGIYHIPGRAVHKTDWTNNLWIEIVVLAGEFATFDGSLLTRLVILAHEFCIRMEIEPANPYYLRLFFHRRQREGGFSKRHPTIEEAVETIRGLIVDDD